MKKLCARCKAELKDRFLEDRNPAFKKAVGRILDISDDIQMFFDDQSPNLDDIDLSDAENVKDAKGHLKDLHCYLSSLDRFTDKLDSLIEKANDAVARYEETVNAIKFNTEADSRVSAVESPRLRKQTRRVRYQGLIYQLNPDGTVQRCDSRPALLYPATTNPKLIEAVHAAAADSKKRTKAVQAKIAARLQTVKPVDTDPAA